MTWWWTSGFLVTRLVSTKRIWTSHPSFTQLIDAPFRSAMPSHACHSERQLHQREPDVFAPGNPGIQAVNSPKMSTRCVLKKPAWRHGDETRSMLKTRWAMLHDSAGFVWGKATKSIAESPLSHQMSFKCPFWAHFGPKMGPSPVASRQFSTNWVAGLPTPHPWRCQEPRCQGGI